jgi:hypothetical protein
MLWAVRVAIPAIPKLISREFLGLCLANSLEILICTCLGHFLSTLGFAEDVTMAG